MSSALVRQALEFVDPDESGGKRSSSKRRKGQSARSGAPGQDCGIPDKRKKKTQKDNSKDKAEENIKKLLALSTAFIDKNTAAKVLERAIKGKPLVEKIKVKEDDRKSILFPD